MRDGCRLIASLYNDRTLFPDDEAPRSCEARHRNRSRDVQTTSPAAPDAVRWTKRSI
jgi:hypothetical protein